MTVTSAFWRLLDRYRALGLFEVSDDNSHLECITHSHDLALTTHTIMAGPRNQKKRKQKKKDKKTPAASTTVDVLNVSEPEPQTVPPPSEPYIISRESLEAHPLPPNDYEEHAEPCPPPPVPVQDPAEEPAYSQYPPYPPEEEGSAIPPSLLKTPFIHDPGNGPRVKDARAFLSSRFAAPPSVDDPLCAEFADEALAEMLCTVLPEETALVRST